MAAASRSHCVHFRVGLGSAVLAIATGCAAPPLVHYLPSVGPSPLRYESSPKVTMVLPPLLMDDPQPPQVAMGNLDLIGPPWPPPPSNTKAAPSISTMNTNTIILASSAAPQVPPPQAEPAAPDLFGNTASATPALTPQMFVQFFQPRNTNGSQPTVVLPVGFNPPPAPASVPSSTATYSKPPPQ